jgi:putative phosphoribosyl transferase
MRDRYPNRADAGRVLAGSLRAYAGRRDVIVLGLPRGGVEVAFEVARALRVPLDVMLVRKLGAPGHEELAMGAIGIGGARVLNDDVIAGLGITDQVIQQVTEREQEELRRRQREYRGDRPGPKIAGQVVILVDDGLATGATMRAAVAAVRQLGPQRVIVAVPVAPPETIREVARDVDEVICPLAPPEFFGVGQWYDDFEQTSDQRVRHLLEAAWTAQLQEA